MLGMKIVLLFCFVFCVFFPCESVVSSTVKTSNKERFICHACNANPVHFYVPEGQRSSKRFLSTIRFVYYFKVEMETQQ